MRRSLVNRTAALFLGLWFAILASEPVPLHACPVHDALPTDTATHAHASHGDAAATSEDDASPDHACGCLGQCNAPAYADAPRAPLGVDTVLAVEVAPVLATVGAVVSSPDFVLPFSNGPPPALAA